MKITPITTEDGRHLLHFEAEPGDLMTAQEAAESCRRRLLEELRITKIADLTPEVFEAARQRYLESSRVPPYAKPQKVIGNFMGHPVVTDESVPSETFFFRSEDSTHAQLSKANDTLSLIRESLKRGSAAEVLDHIKWLLDRYYK